MKISAQRITCLFAGLYIVSACTAIPRDQSSPTIRNIATSGEVIVISDCPSTSAMISAQVTDESAITEVTLWYRVESDKIFSSLKTDKLDHAAPEAPIVRQ